MQAVTGVFLNETEARNAVAKLRSQGIADEHVTLLTPGHPRPQEPVPVDTAEQPGIGKAIGAVVGAASGLSGGAMLMAAIIPGVGPVTAVGLLGAGILGAAGAAIGAAAGKTLETSTTEGLPEDEIFVYEDALHKGRSVVVALAEEGERADAVRQVLQAAGAESIDAARHQWWVGLRSAEREHYTASGRNFEDHEQFYRMGFEAALHARSRCKEFDQVTSEMEADLEELQKKYPGEEVAEAYTQGFQRGREYYQRFCDQAKAA
jgi:hypothetical protein